MIHQRLFIAIGLVFFCFCSRAQMLYDTSYIKKIYDKPIWGLYQNYYSNNHMFTPNYSISDSLKPNANLTAESFKEIGVSFAKNKISWWVNLFGILNTQSDRKPTPKYVNSWFTYCDNNVLSELGVNWFKGYYDINSKNYVPNFNDTTPFYAPGNTRSLNVYIKTTYFTRYKTFSYNAAYRATEIQRKSAWSPLFFVNVDYNRLRTDSSFAHFAVRDLYNEHSFTNRLYTTSLTPGAGLSGTLVLFKTLFFNATVAGGPSLQLQQTGTFNLAGVNDKVKMAWYGNARLSFGLNFNRFFVYSATLIDFKYFTVGKVNYLNQLLLNTFTFGYRFNARKNRFI